MSATTMSCCERPRLSDFGLTTQDASVFYRSQWPKFPHVVFVAYRVIAALYLLAVMIAYMIYQIEVFGGQAFIYLTNLGFIVFTIYLEIAGVVAVLDGCFLRDRNSEDMGIRHKIHWAFFNITANTNILVTIIYWTTLYSSNTPVPFFYDFNVHTLTSIISLTDLFVSPIPVRFLHVIYPVGFDLAYMALTLIFYVAGGRTSSKSGAVYPFIDYGNAPATAAGVIVGVMAGVLLMQGVLWALFKLRMYIWIRRGNVAMQEVDQQQDRMEEGL